MANEERIREELRKAEEDFAATRTAIGIDRRFRPVSTVYNPVSGHIVASVECHTADIFEKGLFFRHSGERTYNEIGSSGPEIHYDNVVTSLTLPHIYYRVSRNTKTERPGEFSGDWLSIDRFDLAQQKAESVVTRGDMQLPEPYSRGWVSQLFGLLADDSAILCSCGLQRPEKGKVHYWLCSIEPHSQKVTLLSRLEGVWF